MPAIVMNGRLVLLSANRLGYALYSPVYEDDPARPVNLARFTVKSRDVVYDVFV